LTYFFSPVTCSKSGYLVSFAAKTIPRQLKSDKKLFDIL